MCPASTSTARPSGMRHPLTMTFLSEPSGFTERMLHWLASIKNTRAVVATLSAARVVFVDRFDASFVLMIVPFVNGFGLVVTLLPAAICSLGFVSVSGFTHVLAEPFHVLLQFVIK